MEVKISVPDRQPYELNATKAQKNKIWKCGYKDQEFLDSLGRDQANLILEEISKAYAKNIKRLNARNGLIFSFIVLIVGVIGANVTADGMQILAITAAGCGVLFSIIYFFKYVFSAA